MCSCADGLCLGQLICYDGICTESSTTESNSSDSGSDSDSAMDTTTEDTGCVPGEESCSCIDGTCQASLLCIEDICVSTDPDVEQLDEIASNDIVAAIEVAETLSWSLGPIPHGLNLPFDNPLHMGISSSSGCGAHVGQFAGGVDFSLYGDLESVYQVKAVAAASGTVIKVVSDQQPGDPGYGNYVLLRHADLTYTVYAHLTTDSITVAEGDVVCVGTALGVIGDTGVTSGEMLHFELRDASGAIQTPQFVEIANLPASCDYYCGTGDPTEGCLASGNAEFCDFKVIDTDNKLNLRLESSAPQEMWVVMPGDYLLAGSLNLGAGVFFGQPDVFIDLNGEGLRGLAPTTIRFENMRFENGTSAFFAGDGGAFAILNGGTLDLYKITIENCMVQDCGGAIYLKDSHLNAESLILMNNSGGVGGGICGYGLNTIDVTGAIISENSATYGSGGIRVGADNSIVTFTNVVMYGNTAQQSAAGEVSGTFNVRHCTIAGNAASMWTGGIGGWGGNTLSVRNSIFYQNTAPDVGGNLFCADNVCSLTRSLFTTNSVPNIDGNWQNGGGNLIGANPQFVSYPSDLHLSQGSPAIGAAENGEDMGAFGGPLANTVPTAN